MESPGHRRNILNPRHTAVNIGIAFDNTAFALVQQFEGDYVDFLRPPTIADGVLSSAGEIKDGGRFSQIQVWYEPSPERLSRRQLFATKSYSLGAGGRPIAFIVPPAPPGTFYRNVESRYAFERPADPRSFSGEGSEPPSCPQFEPVDRVDEIEVVVPWVTALAWKAEGGRFEVEADMSALLAEWGAGVYTIVLWAEFPDGESLDVTNYSMFR